MSTGDVRQVEPSVAQPAASRDNQAQSVSEDVEKGAPTPDSDSESPKMDGPRRSIHGFRWALVCTSIYIAAFTYGLDTTIAADVQAAVIETFGQVNQLAWLGTGFLVGSVSTILPVGNAFERFDKKWGFIAGLTLFEVGSAVCGASPNINALIVGRVIAGIGGAGIYMGALEIISALTSEHERGSYISSLGIFWGLGAVIGPVIGGAFSDSAATWRWAFYINLVIAAVCAPVYLLSLPSIPPTAKTSLLSKLSSIDWVGAVLYAAIWVLFALVFTFAGSTWQWSDGRTIASLVVLGVLLILFSLQQKFAVLTTKADRIFPAHLLRSRTQVLLYIGMAATSAALFVPIYYIPIFFQFSKGDTAIDAAVRLLPFLFISMSANFAIGYFLPKIPYYAALYVVAGVFMIAGGAPLYTVVPSTPVGNVYGYSILVAFGAGLTVQQGYTLASVKLVTQNRFQDISGAIALQNVGQIGSAGIGLVISGQVFQSFAFSHLKEVLADQNFSDAQIRAAVAGTQSAIFHQIDPALAVRATEAITSALSLVYILVITAGAVSIVSGLLMRWERLF